MRKNKIFLSTLLVVCVSLLAIGFFANISPSVTADDKIDKIKDINYIDSIRINDSTEIINGITKSYKTKDKRIILKDSKETLLDIKLITPYETKISSGDSIKFAELEALEYTNNLYDNIELYSINDNYKKVSKVVTMKYKKVSKKTECYVENSNYTKKSFKTCEDYDIIEWIEFDNIKDLPKGSKVGLFTNTIEGENIEWLITYDDIVIYEWASFLVNSLESYYKFDGDVIDEIGVNNGTNSGTSDTSYGIINNARYFDGGDYIDLGDVQSGSWDDFSFNMWVNHTGVNGAKLLGKYYDGIYRSFSWYSKDDITCSGGMLLEASFNGDNSASTYCGGAIGTSGLHMVTLTYSSPDIQFWVDGVNVGNRTKAGGLDDNSEQLVVGYDLFAGGYITGIIDEFGIWTRELTPAEITELYGAGSPPSYPFENNCIFSGFVKDEDGNDIAGANVTIWNQFDVVEYYENTTNSDGAWSMKIPNSTNTYMAGAYYNNTLIGQLKPYISGTC